MMKIWVTNDGFWGEVDWELIVDVRRELDEVQVSKQ